jgi:hypothetical protein
MKRLIALAVLIAASSVATVQPLMAFEVAVVVKTQHHRRHYRHHRRPAHRTVVIVKR